MHSLQQADGKTFQSPRSPEVCVLESPITGVDFTGALYIKDSGEESKSVYFHFHLCSHTCSTHTLYIEIVYGLPVFLFTSRRFSSGKFFPFLNISGGDGESIPRLFESESLQRELKHHNVCLLIYLSHSSLLLCSLPSPACIINVVFLLPLCLFLLFSLVSLYYLTVFAIWETPLCRP